MRHWVTYPLLSHPANPELLLGSSIGRFAQAAEAAGFDGIGFTDHPAPSQKWLDAGGHDALDPFASLAYVAAATSTLRLIPNIVVLPYRNPFIVAKAAATLASLSEGRFVLSVGTGYLRSEYRAVGVDFDERNDRFDESLEVVRGVLSQHGYSFQGANFGAEDVTANPQAPQLPIWIGGNSKISRRRVARIADGWNPFPSPPAVTQSTRTAPMETLADLRTELGYLWRHVDEAGRDRTRIDISFPTCTGVVPGSRRFVAAVELEALGEMADIGVTWNAVGVPGRSIDQAIEALQQYGEEVIGPATAA